MIKVPNEVQTEPSAIIRVMSCRKYHVCVGGKASGKSIKTAYSALANIQHLLHEYTYVLFSVV